MPSLSFRRVPRGALHATACAIATTCFTACASSAPTATLPSSTQVTTPNSAASSAIPVTRYGRYTLVELVPDDDQRNLMQQVVDIAIPSASDASVGNALRYVLLRSGYRLCDSTAAATLYALPLPAAHLHLGPLSLRDALLTLAGPAWDLSIDQTNRQVCFSRQTTPAPAVGSTASAPTESAISPVPSGTHPFRFDEFPPWEMQP